MGHRISKLSNQNTPVLKRVSSASTPLLNNSPPENIAANNAIPRSDESKKTNNNTVSATGGTPQYHRRIQRREVNMAASTPHLSNIGLSEEVVTPLLHKNMPFITNNLCYDVTTSSSQKINSFPKQDGGLYENINTLNPETSPQTSTPKKSPRIEEDIYEEIVGNKTENVNYSIVTIDEGNEPIENTTITENSVADATDENVSVKSIQSPAEENSETSRNSRKLTSTSIRKWLHDLYTLTETECSTLQGKDLTQYQFVRIAQEAVITLNKLTEDVINNFDESIKKIAAQEEWTRSCQDLCSSIHTLADFYDINSTYLHLSTYKPKLMEIIYHLNGLSQRSGKKIEIMLENFKKEIEKYTRILTIYNLQIITQLIQTGNDIYSLKIATSSLITLAEVSDLIRHLISKVGGIQALLDVCMRNKDNSLTLLTLRTLSVICSTPSTVERFVKAEGVECIISVFKNVGAEEIRSEAAGLLTQITAPWMDKCGLTVSKLKTNIDFIVKSLTDLAAATLSEEVFLLAISALANLSYLDSEACTSIKNNNTIQKLVSKYRHHSGESALFIKDQMTTVLANMASSYPNHVYDTGGVILLLCFLQLRPSLMHNKAEIAACERVLQKSAIALSRLSSQKNISSTIIEMQGIHRLVRLCKDRKERNNSDTVLIACLAAIKKISTTQEIEVFKKLDAADLVESHLWDSFLIYSSKVKLNESEASTTEDLV